MPHERAIAGMGGWTPPANLAAWWYAAANVAAGANWVDQIAGYTIPVASGCSVVAGTGLVVPATKAAMMSSSFTPTGGGIGRGSTWSIWIRLNADGSSIVGHVWSGGAASAAGSVQCRNGRVPRAQAYGGGASALSAISLGVWTHLCLAQYWGDDAGQTNKGATLYLNGSPASSPIPGSSTTANNAALLASATAELAIDADDAMWFARRLSSSEVADIYANSPGRH